MTDCTNCKFYNKPSGLPPCVLCSGHSLWQTNSGNFDVEEITYTAPEIMELLGYSPQYIDKNCELYDVPVWAFGDATHPELNCTIAIPQDIQVAISNVINYYKNLGKMEILNNFKKLLDI
jgi:hypothetical protein